LANATTRTGQLMMIVFAGIAKFERDLIQETCPRGPRSGQTAWDSLRTHAKAEPRTGKTGAAASF
jgi:hypothetical protein